MAWKSSLWHLSLLLILTLATTTVQALNIIGPLQFSLQTTPTADTPVFTLTCVFTGDPTATVFWWRDDTNVLSEGTSPTVTNTTITANTNTLTVTGRLPGKYKCRVENNVSRDAKKLNVIAPCPPTGPRAIVITGSNSIVVSWTPPSGGTPPTGYSIYYEAISGGADTGSVTVSGASTSEHTITDRASTAYTVKIVALSTQLPSNVTAEINTTVALAVSILPVYTAPTDAILGENQYRAASQLTLSCQATGATGALSYKWTYNCAGCEIASNVTQNVSVSDRHVPLYNFLRPNYAGVYTCVASDVDDNMGSASTDVNIVGIGAYVQENSGDPRVLTNNALVTPASPAIGDIYLRLQCISNSSRTGNVVGNVISHDGSILEIGESNGQVAVKLADTHPGRLRVINNKLTPSRIDSSRQGVYTCQVYDANDNLLQFSIGIYPNGFNTTPSISNARYLLQQTVLAVNCTSTGSVASSVTWTKNGQSVEIDGTKNLLTQYVTNRAASTYDNVLTVNDKPGATDGNYCCSVTNTVGSASHCVEVTAPEALTVTVDRVNGTHIEVTWEKSSLAEARGDVLSYSILYAPVTIQREDNPVVVPGNKSSVLIGGLDPQQTYIVQVWATTAAGDGMKSVPVEVLPPRIANPPGTASSPSNNTTLIIGVIVAVIVATVILVLAITAVVIVRLVLRHRRSMVSLQKGNRSELLANQLVELEDPKQMALRSCSAYGLIPQPVDESNHDYEVIPLRPLPRLPQTSGQYENTRALQDHRAVVSGQARSTAPSHSPPQELGGDEHLYKPTGGPSSTAPASTATPTTATPGDKEYEHMECGPVTVLPQDI